MSRLETALRSIASELDRLGRSWAVVGGLAVSARTEPRFTRAIDLALAVANDADAAALVRTLVASGYRVLASLEQEAQRRHPGRPAGSQAARPLIAARGFNRGRDLPALLDEHQKRAGV